LNATVDLWALVRAATGQEGIVPSNYVERVAAVDGVGTTSEA
jgi:hypothetical protein